MDDVQAQFFKKLNLLIKRKTKMETCYYTNAVYVFLESFTHRKYTYSVTLGFEQYEQLVVLIGFTEETEDDDFYFLRLDDAENNFPTVYRKWTNKIESLDNLQKFRRWPKSRWIYVENSRGEQLNFKDYSAQIELIDEMDFQCKFIVDSLYNAVNQPLKALFAPTFVKFLGYTIYNARGRKDQSLGFAKAHRDFAECISEEVERWIPKEEMYKCPMWLISFANHYVLPKELYANNLCHLLVFFSESTRQKSVT